MQQVNLFTGPDYLIESEETISAHAFLTTDGGLSDGGLVVSVDMPKGGIEFVLKSDSDLYDYVSVFTQERLPRTIGGQSLGAFYNEDGISTRMRLCINEPTMAVTLETVDWNDRFFDNFGIDLDDSKISEAQALIS